MRKFTLFLLALVSAFCMQTAGASGQPAPVRRLVGETIRHDGPFSKPRKVIPFEEAIASRRSDPAKAVALKAPSSGKRMIATVIYEDDWGGGLRPFRIKRFDIGKTSISASEIIGPGEVNNALYLGGMDYMAINTVIDEMGNHWNTVMLRYDLETAMITAQTSLDPTVRIFTGAYDPSTRKVYTYCAVNTDRGQVPQLMIFNPDTYHFSKVCDLPSESMPVMMFDAKGQLYWHDMGNSNIYKMDKETGEKTLIGNTGIRHQFITSGCIDPEDGTCYIANNTESEAALFQVDLSTGKATKVANMPKSAEIVGAFIAETPPADTAPDVATNVKFNFEKNALTGTITFTAPSTDVSGSKLSPSDGLTYGLMTDNKLLASGSASPGETITVPLSFEKPDTYHLDLTFYNEWGKGKRLTLNQWIGYDVPDKMGTPILVSKNGKFILSWSHPSSLLQEGLDESQLSYTIERNDGKKTELGSVTSFEEDWPTGVTDLKQYYYTVTPHYRGFPYKESKSTLVYLGHVEENYLNTFSTEDTAAHFTAADIDGDNSTFGWDPTMGAFVIGGKIGVKKNDWAFSPAIHLKKGHLYPIQFDLWKELVFYQENYEVRVGRSPEPDAMEDVVIPLKDLAEVANEALGTDLSKHATYLCPEEGDYYFGIHVTSNNANPKVYLDNFLVDYSTVSTTPAGVDNLQCIPGALGAMTAEIRFNAPSKDITGNPLKSLDGVKIFRDGELIATLKPAPGEEVSYTDNLDKGGFHTYLVQCEGSDTTGPRISGECYVGYDVPPMVQNITIDIKDYTIVNLKWDKVEADIHGLAYAPGMVEYEIFVYQNGNLNSLGKVSNNYAAFEYTLPGQTYFLFAIRTWANDMGSEEYAQTDMELAGKPFELPFRDSFANGRPSYSWFVQNVNQMHGDWAMCGDNVFLADEDDPFYGFRSADNDNGFVLYQGFFEGDSSMLFCGNINVPSTTANPYFSFYHLIQPDNNNTVDIMVKKPQQEWETIATVSLTGDSIGWKEEYIDLSALKGQVFQLGLMANVINKDFVMFDALRLYDRPAKNLRVTAPGGVSATVGEKETITFKVDNNGLKDMPAASLNVDLDGEEIAVINIPALKVGESFPASCEFTLNPLATKDTSVAATIVSDDDEDSSDNRSVAKLNVIYSDFPAPRSLSVVKTEDDAALLTWTEPDPELYPRVGDVEDFESYTHMQTSDIGDWTLYNCGLPKEQVPNVDWPEINGQNVGFFILDEKSDIMLKYLDYRAHSGKKFIANVYNRELLPNDEWLISAVPSDRAYTLSFWARSGLKNWLEDIEVLLSSTGNAREDFTEKVIYDCLVPAEWTKFEFKVPEGTKYVALRSIGLCKGILMVDDFNVRKGKPVEAEFLGYNIYRDGKIINDTPVKETTFTDTNATSRHHYRVTAVYSVGESRVSNGVVFNMSGIVSAQTAQVKVFTETGRIIVAGAEGDRVTVTDIAGRGIARLIADSDRTEINVEPGIYVVTVGNRSVKLIVK